MGGLVPTVPYRRAAFFSFVPFEYFYSATPFHLVHVLLSLYSRAHTYAPGDAYISALLHSSEQDSDKGKVIYRNAHHLAVTCAGGTRSYTFVWYLFFMPFAFCSPFLEPPFSPCSCSYSVSTAVRIYLHQQEQIYPRFRVALSRTPPREK